MNASMITMWCIKWLDLCWLIIYLIVAIMALLNNKKNHCAQRMNIKGGPFFSPFTLVLCWECGCYVKNTKTLSFVHRKVLVNISFFCFVLCSFSFLICLFSMLFFFFLMFSTKKVCIGNYEGFFGFLFSY